MWTVGCMILLSQIPLGIDVESKRKGSFEFDFLFFVELTEQVGQGGVEFGKMKNKIKLHC
jgi:hypothetical protein